jgi:hypothetical protein
MSKSCKQGRPTLLNPTLQKRICKLLAEGCDQKTACNISGIGERTYHDWKERGRNGEEPYASFFSATSRVRDQHKARLIAVVMEAAHKDARHAEWLLERQFPKEFAPISARDIPVSIAQPAAPNVHVVHMYDDQSIEMRRLQDGFAERQRENGQPFSAPDSKSPPPPPAMDTPVVGTDAGEKLVSDRGAAANLMKRHALAGRASQIPTSDS